ncbi:UNVERIFIED_CONTAM: hypothetical protein PYX00_009163 [Menopon gallinae]|uniref:RNA polymerase I-specific transcription initiation factor RRN3 n=1 Tax=Menopon gallinae TaxID=328185 RepID=A0AAW2HA72_9NEOP
MIRCQRWIVQSPVDFKMSLITTRSSLLSILKLPNPGGQRNSLHRVRFRLPTDIKRIFQNYKSNCNFEEYESLVSIIRDDDISDSDLLSLLKEAKNCIPILNYDLRLFVQALNIIRWTNRGDEVVETYKEFINDLVTAHSQHTKVVMDQLVKLFSNIEDTEWSNYEPVESQKKQFENIHSTLKSIIERVPLSEDVLLECLSHNFPHLVHKTSFAKQLCYVYNTLKVLSYQPHLRVNILQIIIDQLLVRDVHTSRDDIMQAEEQQADLLYEMEVDEDPPLQRLKHPVADTLDGIMELLFMFIKSECYDGEKLNQVKCHKLYNELLNMFETAMLPTHSHHIQFIMFYICSFENTLAQKFLKFLWSKAISPNIPPVIRHAAISYLAGFLARGEYVLLGYLKNYLTKMGDWINNYISSHRDLSESNPSAHSVFYFMCQAVFYLIAFRHEDLVDSRSRLTFLQGLNLSQIITCKLNPLRVCAPELLERFADVARDYQLAYCYTIIENNSRNALPVVDSDRNIKTSPVIELYFPFDPLLLPRCHSFIKPLYREYSSSKCKDMEDVQVKQSSQGSLYKEGFSPNISTGLSYEN